MRGQGSGTVRNYFPAYRVFIFGIEVTALCSSVRISWPTNTPAQCTIELINPNSLMTITEEDIIVLAQMRTQSTQQIQELFQKEFRAWQLAEAKAAGSSLAGPSLDGFGNDVTTALGLFQERLKVQDTLDAILNNWTNPTFRTAAIVPPITAELAQLKNNVIPKKIAKGKFITSLKGPDNEKLPPELFFKYPFYQGKSIWHFSDPVSVVFRDPADPSIWYWAHRGTVTDVAEKETEDKQSILTITSEGVLKALRNARAMNATGAIQTPEIEGMGDDEFFSLLTSIPYSNFLQRLTLRNILELMVFGSQSLIDDLEERVHKGVSSAELEERFGVLIEGGKRTDRVTDKDVEYYKTSLRNLKTTGLHFKMWRGNQGVELRIVGGPLDPTDQTTGEATTLYDWQRLIDNRVRVSDIGTMLVQQVDLAQGQDAGAKKKAVAVANVTEVQVGENALKQGKTIESAITEICTDVERYPINQRVRLLMPAHLGARLKSNIIDQDLSSNIASSAEFFDRLTLLQQTLERIEFCLYDTPRGDIVVEFPLYDFEPRHFSATSSDPIIDQPSEDTWEDWKRKGTWMHGLTSGIFAELQEYFQPTEEVRFESPDEVDRYLPEGDQQYEQDFVISKFDQISFDLSSSEQDVKTAFIVRPRLLPSQADDQSRTAKKHEIAVLPNLIPLYGLRVEQGDSYGAITSPEAARVFAQVMLNRTNADSDNLRVPCLPNWTAWPNRPVFIESRNIVATTKSVTQSIVWQSDASTEYGLWHCKFWDGRMTADGKYRLFVPFGGVNARPFNYAYLLGIKDRNSDVNATNKSVSDALLSAYSRTGRR